MEIRTCGECSTCCGGWLAANIHGHEMAPGKPCYFLQQGKCSNYAGRPDNPCKQYSCAWLEDTTFPDWLKPNLTNVIISKKVPENKNLTYYDVIEAGGKIDSEVLNWIIRWALSQPITKNLIYSVNGNKYVLGTTEFIEAVHALQQK